MSFVKFRNPKSIGKLKRIQVNLYLEKENSKFLEKLPGTRSEHIRRAIDDYIEKLKIVNSSASESKVGEENG